jgi:hypothetical protein
MQDIPMIAANLFPGYAVGCLEGTFGDCIPALTTLANTKKLSAFRIHLLNGSCWRDHNCDKDEPRLDDYATLAKRAANFEKFHNLFPSVGCFLSPILEYDITDARVVSNLAAIVHKNAPSCEAVLSPSGIGKTLPGYLIERHSKGTGDITSNDGATITDTNAAIWANSGRVITFGWTSYCNLRVSEELSWTAPKKRTHPLTEDDFIQIQQLLQPPSPKPTTPPPAQCKKILSVSEKPVKELWKTNTEDPGNGAPRNNKPALISHIPPTGSKEFTVLSPSGTRIGCLKFFANYGTGLYRYYAGLCSGDTAESFYRKSGNEWIYLQSPTTNECYEISSIRRTGYFK